MLIKITDIVSLIKNSLPNKPKYYVVIINRVGLVEDLESLMGDDDFIKQKLYEYDSLFYFSFQKYAEFEVFVNKVKKTGFSHNFYSFMNGEMINV